MLNALVTASRFVGLTYKLLSTSLLIGLVAYEAVKYVRKERGK